MSRHASAVIAARLENRGHAAATRRSWGVAIVTNGLPSVQRLKVQALGLESPVDTVVYASEHGTGAGKPDREPFREALRRLGSRPSQAIFVGDNPDTDIAGASLCGLRTIYTHQFRTQSSWSHTHLQPTRVIHHISEVPPSRASFSLESWFIMRRNHASIIIAGRRVGADFPFFAIARSEPRWLG